MPEDNANDEEPVSSEDTITDEFSHETGNDTPVPPVSAVDNVSVTGVEMTGDRAPEEMSNSEDKAVSDILMSSEIGPSDFEERSVSVSEVVKEPVSGVASEFSSKILDDPMVTEAISDDDPDASELSVERESVRISEVAAEEPSVSNDVTENALEETSVASEVAAEGLFESVP